MDYSICHGSHGHTIFQSPSKKVVLHFFFFQRKIKKTYVLHKRGAVFDPGMTQILEVSTFSPIYRSCFAPALTKEESKLASSWVTQHSVGWKGRWHNLSAAEREWRMGSPVQPVLCNLALLHFCFSLPFILWKDAENWKYSHFLQG